MARRQLGSVTLPPLQSMEHLTELINEYGFFPFFISPIPGFSVIDATPGVWQHDGSDGPWQWKGPMLRDRNLAYGKFFNRKHGYISMEWFPHFWNYRSTKNYAPDPDTAALDDIVAQTIAAEGHLNTKQILPAMGIPTGRRKRQADELVDQSGPAVKISLDPILGRLMMEVRIVTEDFDYDVDKHGHQYGWGIARYTTPELMFGNIKASCSPEESYELMLEHLRRKFPNISDTQLKRFLG